ncbi:unnamed protein product [Protopolystoma xenopodis]|uniref:Uncharacterized protein n=1 Tax=Protopolystoma xenopodis TaxID=117903 RepID=A0A448X5K3_9PLAT|nr:unnamed protein product [Protopolystoma xenopodis]
MVRVVRVVQVVRWARMVRVVRPSFRAACSVHRNRPADERSPLLTEAQSRRWCPFLGGIEKLRLRLGRSRISRC